MSICCSTRTPQGQGLKVVHCIHHPVSARRFIDPIVRFFNERGIYTELWYQADESTMKLDYESSVPHRKVAMDLTTGPVRFFRRLSNFRRHLRDAGPHILHAHQTRAAVIPLLAARLEKVPVRIYHNHGLPYFGHSGALRRTLRGLEQVNMALATDLLLVSHSNLEEARLDGLIRSKRAMVPGAGSIAGIDLGEFAPERFTRKAKLAARGIFGLADSDFVLGYVGRPVKRKGFHRLLSAWNQLDLKQSGAALLVAGCSQKDCERALGRPLRNVKALGHQEDMLLFYAACDAVILPSDHEGFPYALLEGAAAGCALLGSDIPGIRCAVKHGHTGLLFPRGDLAALRDAIVKCASDPELRGTFGRNARARVELEFDRQTVLNEILSLYETEFAISPRSCAGRIVARE